MGGSTNCYYHDPSVPGTRQPCSSKNGSTRSFGGYPTSIIGIRDIRRIPTALRGEYPMNSGNADFSTILNRILDTAADNLRITKILVQMGLDPNNITYDALFNRMLEIMLANITLANMFALVGAIFLVATLLMHTMVPLRIANTAGCTFFVAFGALSGNVATFILYLLLLPINAIRLRQMLNLIKRARIATEGDTATEMFSTVTGKFLVREIDVELPPGRLMGE
jgi:hypothetical protein